MSMIVAALTVVGLSLGSFINALVWRLRQQENYESQQTKNDKQKTINDKRYSILKGRSICPNCKHKLAEIDLVPVLSWLMLRGKCRYCKKPISAQYPLVEAATASLFVLSYIHWPGFQGQSLKIEELVLFAVWLATLTGLVALAVYDIRWMILPNKIIFPLYGLVAVDILFQSAINHNLEPITSSMLGILVGGGIFYVLFQISSGKWIGGGDVKLGFLLGAIVGGPLEAFLLLFIASLLGSIFSIPMILKNRLGAKSKIPFGPFLIAAAIIVWLFGANIIDWYQSFSVA